MGIAITSKLMSIGMIAISFVIGFVFFYVSSHLPKVQKKALIEEMFSQLVNFIVFIWVGKVILNINVFIKDPLAILAYPSNSDAFYVAVLMSIIVLFYKAKKKKFDVLQFVTAFLPAFLAASFVYEFFQMISKNNTYSFEYLTLSTILLIVFLVINDRLTSKGLILIMLICWSVGMLLLAYTQPFVTLFGYLIAPRFIELFFITNLLFIFMGKRDVNERN